MHSLRDKTISGMLWSFLQKVGVQGIGFIVTILLARLLTPKDFGLIGMLMIFVQVSQAFVDGGFNLALIQKREVDDKDFSSVFFVNLFVAICLYVLLFFTSPLVARFYRQPVLSSLLRVLALIFVINAFSFVQEARLTKDIRFKTLMLIHIPSTIFGGVVSIFLALLGFGVWSIVAMQLLTRVAYTIQIWIYAKWKPLLYFSREKIVGLFSFGGKLLITNVFTTVFNNIVLVIIGRFFPLSSVGYYQNANSLATMPSNTLTNVLNSVTFPVFSSIQDNNHRLKTGYRQVMQQAFFWICPTYILAGVLAEPLFRFVFTAKWLPAVPYFQCLCIIGIIQPLKTYNLNIINVKGRSDLYMRLQIIWKIVTLLGIILAIPFGIFGLLIMQASSYILAFLLFSYYSGRFISYPLLEQMKDIFDVLLLSMGIGIFVLWMNKSISSLPDFVRLIMGFGLGGLAYWMLAGYFRFPPYMDFKTIFHEKIINRFISRQ